MNELMEIQEECKLTRLLVEIYGGEVMFFMERNGRRLEFKVSKRALSDTLFPVKNMIKEMIEKRFVEST